MVGIVVSYSKHPALNFQLRCATCSRQLGWHHFCVTATAARLRAACRISTAALRLRVASRLDDLPCMPAAATGVALGNTRTNPDMCPPSVAAPADLICPGARQPLSCPLGVGEAAWAIGESDRDGRGERWSGQDKSE